MPKTVTIADVVKNDALTSDALVKKMVLSAPRIAECAKAGQFIQLKTTRAESSDPLLRRPFSIADADAAEGTISVIYRVVGRGTAIMAEAKPGDCFDLMGPLGNGFTILGENRLLIGGGMGLAPLVFLAKKLHSSKTNQASALPSILMGGRNRQELFWLDIFQGICQNAGITTDDGSLGFKGLIPELLPDILANASEKFDVIYACGPRPMLAGVAGIAKKFNILCQVSLEEHMACGLGACLSCTCQSSSLGKRLKVCADGPVFDALEVAW